MNTISYFILYHVEWRPKLARKKVLPHWLHRPNSCELQKLCEKHAEAFHNLYKYLFVQHYKYLFLTTLCECFMPYNSFSLYN